jgi:uncharacterized membrane protein (DUF441 family)
MECFGSGHNGRGIQPYRLELNLRAALTTSQLLDVEQLLRQNVELRTVRNGMALAVTVTVTVTASTGVVYQQGIVPLSEINRFRSLVRVVYAVADGVLAAKLLGRAVYSVCHSPTVVQMHLSGTCRDCLSE